MRKEFLGTIWLFTVAIIWGAAFIAVDVALKAGWETFPLLMVRGFLGGLVLLPFCYKKRFWKDKKTLTAGVILGVLFFLAYTAQTIGQSLSTVQNSAFLTVLYVMFSPIVVRLLFKQKQEIKVYFAGALSIIGVLFITIIDSDSGFSVQLGDLVLILCALLFAFHIVFAERLGKNYDVLSISCIQLFVMGILSSFMMPITGQTTLLSDGLIGVLYAAIFSSAIASVLQISAQKYVNPGRASIIMAQETLVAAILAFIIAKEFPSLAFVTGGCLMFVAILIVEVKFKKKLKLENYEFLLFDVDDTLLNFKKAEQEGIKKAFKDVEISITEDMLIDYSKINKKLWQQFETGEITKEDIFKARFNLFINKWKLENCKGEQIELAYRKYLAEGAYLIDHAIEVLESLKNKYTLIIVTNGIAKTQHNRLKLSGIGKYFEYLFISEEINAKKPDFEFFDYVNKTVKNFNSRKALIIGDSLTSDILGGNNYNIDTCWFNPNRVINETTINPTFEIDDLLELIQRRPTNEKNI